MQVREIMTENPACCMPDSTLQEVARMMEQNDCGCIPVVNNLSEMKPVGTITDRDITIRTIAASHNPINMKASDIMTADVAMVKPQMSVEECLNVMEDKEIRLVLVVDGQGKCCGIVAQADIVQSTANPIRTNKVIREISESAPSRNQKVPMGRHIYQSNSDYRSFMSAGTLYPLLIGLGSGVGLMYLMNSRRNETQREYVGDLDAYLGEHVNRQDVTNQENFGKYADAEHEIEKRQHDLEDRVQTLRTELDSPLNDRQTALNEKDDVTENYNKGRSASQGN